jgi:hypothetical protein
MMTLSLVERLRGSGSYTKAMGETAKANLLLEAAAALEAKDAEIDYWRNGTWVVEREKAQAEIERLREALEKIVKKSEDYFADSVARAALNQSDGG